MSKELDTELKINAPDLDNLIKALECDQWASCQKCPYGYSYPDRSGDNLFYACDEQKLIGNAVFYLKMYQYLINNQKSDN